MEPREVQTHWPQYRAALIKEVTRSSARHFRIALDHQALPAEPARDSSVGGRPPQHTPVAL